MIPQKTVEELIAKHSLLEKDLSSGNIDKKLFAEKSKEYSDLNEIIEDAKKYISFENDKTELKKILEDQKSDAELLKMAETELKDLQTQYEKNDQESRFRRVGENVRSGQETVRPEERKIQRDHVCWTSR